jgi:16S rRNA (adenine1518-N6/adenine1519-N6)-dimethyltransferase
VNTDRSNWIATFAKKSFGQNFLVDPKYIRKIVDAAQLTSDDTVVEIGPGRGALTGQLIEKARQVIAIELDTDLAPMLEEEYREHSNFELVNSDILKLDLSRFAADTKLKVVANLPYYISTAVLQHLIANRQYLSNMVLMFQREVVDRIVAEPGNSERGYLTVLVEAFLITTRLFDVPPAAFRPAPKVWSSVVGMIPREVDPLLSGRETQFERMVSAAFRQKRKTILNNLKAAAKELNILSPIELLNTSEISPERRAETFTLEEWTRLFIRYVG